MKLQAIGGLCIKRSWYHGEGFGRLTHDAVYQDCVGCRDGCNDVANSLRRRTSSPPAKPEGTIPKNP